MEKITIKTMNAVVPIHHPVQALLARNVMVEEESVFKRIVDEIKR